MEPAVVQHYDDNVTLLGARPSQRTNPFIQNIALPTDGVVYVQDDEGTPPTVNDGSTPCFNPYENNANPPWAANSAECVYGDVYLEGELHGQLTVGSAANIMVTRDLTYWCADNGSSGAVQTNPSSLPACTTESTPDVLGLSAKYDVLISGNTGNAGNTNCSTSGYGDGTGAPTNTGTMIGGTSYPNDPKAVWPTLCNPQNVIIDAAVFGVQGSFGVENWDTTPQSGGAYLNGSDLSEYRGPFAYVGQTGYNKEFSFDQRLAYAAPPHVLPNGVPLWQQRLLCAVPECFLQRHRLRRQSPHRAAGAPSRDRVVRQAALGN